MEQCSPEANALFLELARAKPVDFIKYVLQGFCFDSSTSQ